MAMSSLRFAALLSACALALLGSVHGGALWQVTDWADAHATFYGGYDASGTMGGACGYGNLYSQGYGTNTAALSNALFNDGLTCGACFELQCNHAKSPSCYPGKSVVVTATNNCPQGSYGGWCDAPHAHFDCAYPAFSQLAPAVTGVIAVQFKRVSCTKDGGIKMIISGNPWYTSLTMTNVAGDGAIESVSIKGGNGALVPMTHNWGQVWSAHSNLVGQTLSFYIKVSNGAGELFSNVANSNWQFGQTYETDSNFT